MVLLVVAIFVYVYLFGMGLLLIKLCDSLPVVYHYFVLNLANVALMAWPELSRVEITQGANLLKFKKLNFVHKLSPKKKLWLELY